MIFETGVPFAEVAFDIRSNVKAYAHLNSKNQQIQKTIPPARAKTLNNPTPERNDHRLLRERQVNKMTAKPNIIDISIKPSILRIGSFMSSYLRVWKYEMLGHVLC